jgi:hypothetical protein|tara:strand:- start:624 stop:1451 length:828 start_codon:yes stop_codon:yes gene_type:complete
MKIIETIASKKLMNGSFIVRNLVNKGLNRSISKLLKMKSSIVLYKGISLLDNKTNIMVVLSGYTKDSTNTKTGPLAQIYILSVDTLPVEAYKSGSRAVCGSCRYNGGNGCYVRWSHLKSLWNSARTQNPISKELTKELLKGLRVRVGAAGDPLAVPADFWKDILSSCESYTGYTHQWLEPFAKQYNEMFMASVDTEQEKTKAFWKGWNTFQVLDNEDPESKSVQCLATIPDKTDINGLPMSCASCMMCNGKGAKAVHVQLHGATNTMKAARKARA